MDADASIGAIQARVRQLMSAGVEENMARMIAVDIAVEISAAVSTEKERADKEKKRADVANKKLVQYKYARTAMIACVCVWVVCTAWTDVDT